MTVEAAGEMLTPYQAKHFTQDFLNHTGQTAQPNTVKVLHTEGETGQETAQQTILQIGEKHYHATGNMENPADWGEEGEPYYSWYEFRAVQEHTEPALNAIITSWESTPEEQNIIKMFKSLPLNEWQLSDWATDKLYHGEEPVTITYNGKDYTVLPLATRVKSSPIFYSHHATMNKVINIDGEHYMLEFTYNSWVGLIWQIDATKKVTVEETTQQVWRHV